MRGFHPAAPMPAAEVLPLMLVALGLAAEQVPAGLDAQVALYRSMLAGKRVLLVLDNVADADQARPLLPGDPGCLAVITSRDRLSGLVALDGAHRLTLDVLSADEALAVLARATGPARVDADRDSAVELTELCGHLPLALRIAGARLADRPDLDLQRHVADLVAHGRVSRLRVDGGATATVRGAFGLSYRALPEPARRVFRLLSLVPTPAGLAGPAAAALTGLPAGEVEPLIDALARLHLVKITAAGWVVCHDLLLHYAAELAGEQDPPAERDAATARLLHFYLHTTDHAATALIGRSRLRLPREPVPAGVTPVEFAEQTHAREWIAAEWANLIAAVDHAAATTRHRLVWQLADALRGFLQMQAPLTQTLRIARTGLGAAQSAGDTLGEAAMRLSLGYQHWRTADCPAMLHEAQTVAKLARRAAWPTGRAVGLANSGIALIQLGRTRQAIHRFAQSLAIDRETGDRVGEGTLRLNLAAAYEQVGDLAAAAESAELAVTLLQETSEHQAEAIAHENLAMVRRQQGRFDDALDAIERSLRISRTIGAHREEASALHILGQVHRDTAGYDDAVTVLTASLDLARRSSDTRVEGFAHTSLAGVQLRQRKFAEGATSLEHAREITDRTGHRPGMVETLLTLAELHNLQGDHHRAREHASTRSDLARPAGYTLAVAQAHTELAAASLGMGEPTDCLAHCRRALATQRRAGQRLAHTRTCSP